MLYAPYIRQRSLYPTIYFSNISLTSSLHLLLLAISVKCEDTNETGSTSKTPTCEFSGTLMSSVKMPWSSECSVVVGDLVVDSTSNITESQLQNLFQNVTSVQGSVTVRNTTLKQLSFLKNIEILTRGYLDNVLEIVGNPLLTQIQIDRLNRSDGIVVITDNRELDVKKYCQLFDRVLLGNRIILRNKGNCGFQLDFPLTFTSILGVPANLSIIYGNLQFEETAIPPERLSVLRSVKKLYGCLTVYVTNFETLSFLENLEEIICQSRTDTAVWITTNHYMENLGLRKLTKIVTQRQLEIVSNRILQITIEEAEIFASASVGGDRVQGIFSTDDLPLDVCMFNSLKDDITLLHENCTSTVGLLYYEGRSFSEAEVKKLQQIHRIYGNVDFIGMDIKDLSMFSSLEEIISLNATFPAVRLGSIKNHLTLELPMLRMVYAPTSYKFSIDNCPKLNVTLADCDSFKKIMNEVISIEWMDCDTWYEWKMSSL